jgi:hypothetical protein
MNVINIFSRFFMTVGYVFVQLLQNEGPYMIAIFITYRVLGITRKSKCERINSEYTVTNIK